MSGGGSTPRHGAATPRQHPRGSGEWASPEGVGGPLMSVCRLVPPTEMPTCLDPAILHLVHEGNVCRLVPPTEMPHI